MDKSEAIGLLERCTGELTDAEILTAMKRVLYLPLCYYPAVQAIVSEGRWRDKQYPIAYVKKAAMAKAIHMGLADDPRERFTLITPILTKNRQRGKSSSKVRVPIAWDEFYDYITAKRELGLPRRSGGVWKAPGDLLHWESAGRAAGLNGRVREFKDREDHPVTAYEHLVGRIPPDLKRTVTVPVHDPKTAAWLRDAWRENNPDLEMPAGYLMQEETVEVPDWTKIAQRAGLNKGEGYVLQLRAAGYGRDRAMALQRTAKGKRFVQAAWRRLTRKWDRVVSVLNPGASSN
ncbi:MAG: hypothetical protein IT158_24110 [Bryobacterales bacterium]|nr:hypothetical protein [Bryobacterales bacterium]